MNKKILFIDADVELLALLEKLLSLEGYKVILASGGSEGLHLAYEQHPDLIITSISMPIQDGFEVCRNLREFSNVPILMLTARSSAADIKHGFAVGADDYMIKPFSNDELLSRVKALLWRGKNAYLNKNDVAINNYADAALKVDLRERSCTVKGNSVSLTATEFNLLSVLIQHPNQILSIHTLLAEVWGDGYGHNKGLLSLYIHQLRKKLQDNNEKHKYIQTQWGKGYFFSPLPKAEEPIVTHNLDRGGTDKVKPAKRKINKWLGISILIILLLLTVLAASIFTVFARPAKGSTSLESLITAEGFFEKDVAGVRGQICVTNTGTHPTQNLSIVNSAQILDQKHYSVSSSANLSRKPVLAPGESHCYSYQIPFEARFDEDVKYRSAASITITNYFGMLPGTDHCLGPDLCSFGQNVTADFSVPMP